MNTNDLSNYLSTINSNNNILENFFKLNHGERDKAYSGIDLSQLSDIDRALLQQLYFADGDRDANLQVLQNKLEIALGERNYERSLPINQVAQLQAAGMSRAAALQLLQGGGTSALQVSPMSTDIEGHDLQRNNLIANTSFQTIDALQRIATLPFDIRSKAATADLLRSQDTMLNEQKQGFALSAAAIQAASNNGFQFEGSNANDLLAFLQSNQNMKPLLESIQSNPYAFSSLSHLMSQDFQTRASSYEPKFAQARMQQQIALTHLTQNDESNIQLNNLLLNNDVYRDTVATTLFQQVEYAKANQIIAESDVNVQRLQNILQHIKEFNDYDLELVQFQLQQIRDTFDPEFRQAHIENLINSERWQALQALYAYGTTELLQNTLSGETSDPDSRRALLNASRKYLYGVTLGGYESQQNLQRWMSAGAATVGAIGGAFLIGSKVLSPKVVATPMLNSFTPTITNTGYTPYVIQ